MANNVAPAKSTEVNLGLTDEQTQEIITMLSKTLADQHILYMKLRNYHWNVTGPNFVSLHELFEQQYTALATAIDDTAERIRQYGGFAPGSFEQMLELARLEGDSGVPSANDMVANLVADHEAVIRQLREDIDTADDHDEDALEDFYTAMLQTHMKDAWMLRAFLG